MGTIYNDTISEKNSILESYKKHVFLKLIALWLLPIGELVKFYIIELWTTIFNSEYFGDN